MGKTVRKTFVFYSLCENVKEIAKVNQARAMGEDNYLMDRKR